MGSDEKQTATELAKALEAISVEVDPAGEFTVERNGPLDAFNAMSLDVVRPQHAIDAASNPDGVAVYGYQDARMLVATKKISIPAGDFVLLAIGTEQGRRRLIDSAFRLYGDAAEVDRLAADATTAFQTFLERFAIPYESKGRDVLFVPVITGTIPGGTQPNLETILSLLGIKWRPGERPDKPLTLHADITFRPTGEMVLTWPFVVDTNAYKDAIAQR